MAKNRGIYWLLCPMQKLRTTHHAEGNSMASPTQTAVGKGKPNLLIADNLLKFLRDLIPPITS